MKKLTLVVIILVIILTVVLGLAGLGWRKSQEPIPQQDDKEQNREPHSLISKNIHDLEKKKVTSLDKKISPPYTISTLAWSYDNKKIVFEIRKNSITNIWGLNIETGETLQLTNGKKETLPAWTVDNKKILYSKQEGNNLNIWIMNKGGTNKERITSAPTDEWDPLVSPNGEKIVFLATNKTNPYKEEIWIMNINGEDKKQLISDLRRKQKPIWSADMKKIIFKTTPKGLSFSERTYDPLYELRAINIETKKEKLLVDTGQGSVKTYNRLIGGKIFYTFYESETDRTSTWIINKEGFNKKQLIKGLIPLQYKSLSVNAEAKKMALVFGGNIWIVELVQ